MGKFNKLTSEIQVAVVEKLLKYPAECAIWINNDMRFNSRTQVKLNLLKKYTFPYNREIKAASERHNRLLLLHSVSNLTLILKDLAMRNTALEVGLYPIQVSV